METGKLQRNLPVTLYRQKGEQLNGLLIVQQKINSLKDFFFCGCLVDGNFADICQKSEVDVLYVHVLFVMLHQIV